MAWAEPSIFGIAFVSSGKSDITIYFWQNVELFVFSLWHSTNVIVLWLLCDLQFNLWHLKHVILYQMSREIQLTPVQKCVFQPPKQQEMKNSTVKKRYAKKCKIEYTQERLHILALFYLPLHPWQKKWYRKKNGIVGSKQKWSFLVWSHITFDKSLLVISFSKYVQLG